MRSSFTAAVLLVACDGGLDPMVPRPDDVIAETTPLVPPPDGPPEDTDDTPGPSEDCFAEFTYAVDFVTTVTGIDLFDQVETTRVLYQERDEGNDGTVDITVTYDYDANGWLVAKTTDEEGHGTLLETWTHDDAGRDLLYTEDHFADGDPEHTIDRAYDANGALVWVSVDDDGDELADLVLTWTRGANGEALTQEVDSNGDGVHDFTWAFTYDGEGRQVAGAGDKKADGELDIVATTVYTDPVLEIGLTNMDAKINGTIDEIMGFERDALGRSLWEATDELADGTWDVETFTTWDPVLAVPPLEVETFYPFSPDGPVHQTLTSTYDELGRRTSYHDRLDINGDVTDAMSTWTFTGSCP